MRTMSRLVERVLPLKWLVFGRARRRIPYVRQVTASDCGAACLAMVLGYYGKRVPLDEIRRAMGAGRDDTDGTSLLRVARLYGLCGRGVRAEVEALQSLPESSILCWELHRYVVLRRVRRDSVEFVDPAGDRRLVPMDRFRRSYTGVAFIFEPTEAFEPSPAKPRRIWWPLIKQVLESSGLLGRIILTSFFIQALSAAMPLLTGVLIDRVVPRKDYSLLLILAAAYSLLQLFNALTGFVRAHLLVHLRTQMEVRFTLRFFNHLLELPYAFFHEHTMGDLMVRLGSNSAVKEILTSAVLSTVMDGFAVSFYLILLMLANLPLTILVAGLALARISVLALMLRKQREFLAESLEVQSRSQTYQVEMLSAMETLKAMGLERRAAENWSSLFADGLNVSIKRGRLDAAFSILLSLLGTVSTLSLMFYGTFLVLKGTLTLGTMMAFNALAVAFFGPLNSLVTGGLQVQMLEVYLERINDVMDTRREQNSNATELGSHFSGAIRIERGSFRYSKHGPLVLEEISFAVSPGSWVALVGRTGSGKSTLARLMVGLYEPSSGRILFDEKDLRDLNLNTARSHIGVVTQDIQLFAGSIRQNIALADPKMEFDRVIVAAKLACIHDDIMAMPMAYDTLLTDRGLSLSGGQRQRLAIARALARRPSILLLDEATSHLDAITERQIIQSINKIGCTRIVIANGLRLFVTPT
jgi:ATP-binding cassette subfamily B protein